MARTRWRIPFCRVMRPTKSTLGCSGTTPSRRNTSGARVRRYSSGSIPLWITRTRSGATPYSDCTSSFIASDTAITPSAFW